MYLKYSLAHSRSQCQAKEKKNQKWSKCPSVPNWMKAVHQIEHYQALKINMGLDICWYQNISMAYVECKKHIKQHLSCGSVSVKWHTCVHDKHREMYRKVFPQIWISLGRLFFFSLYPSSFFNRPFLRLPCVNFIIRKNSYCFLRKL